jgi:hypothetical protein
VTGPSTELNMPVDDLLAAPFLLVGSDDEILTAIRQRQQRWGINRLVIREDAIDKLAPLLPRNDRVVYREATITLESMTIWLTRF